MAKYSYLTDKSNNNRKIQVESAKRDGDGKNIKNNYAKQNGYYGAMGVGQADSIASNREIEDTSISCPPITFGIAGGEAEIQTGQNKFEYLEGKSIKFNQLVDMHLNYASKYGVTFTLTNGTIHAEGTASGTGYTICGREMLLNKTHKYLFKGFKWKSNEYTIYLYATGTGGSSGGHGTTYRVDGTTGNGIFTFNPNSGASEVSGWQIFFYMFSGVAINVTSTPQIFDLTEIYGAGNEPTTVEQFEKDFPLAYYGKDTGSIISAKSATLVSRGKNQFSALDTFIRVVGGETYEISGISAGGVLKQYDINQNLIDTSDTFTDTVDIELEEETAYVKITATTYEDIMFYNTFAEDGGVYGEEYEEPKIQIVELPNIELRSVGNVKDIAYASGGGKRKVGIVDLGSLTWSKIEDNVFVASATALDILAPILHQNSNIVSTKYTVVESLWHSSLSVDKTFTCQPNKAFVIRDTSYNDASAFKTAVTGIKVLFILATETDIPLPENPGWTELVFVDNYGTLEFTTSPAQVPQVEQPYFIRYTVSLTEFVDTAYVRTKGDGNNIATEEEVEEIRKGNDAVGLSRASESLTPYSDESGATDTSAFVMQTAGGDADINDTAYLRALRGKTIKWNQGVNSSGMFSLMNSGTYNYTQTDNDITISVITEGSRWRFGCFKKPTGFSGNSNHKYLIRVDVTNNLSVPIAFYSETNSAHIANSGQLGNGKSGKMALITTNIDDYFNFNFVPATSITVATTETIVVKKGSVEIFDLTDIFGVGNEPTTVEEFNRIFPKPYYEYNAGELLSSKVNGYKTIGYNAFNGETENGYYNGEGTFNSSSNFRTTNFIKVIAGQTYTCEVGWDTNTNSYVNEFDENKNFIKQTAVLKGSTITLQSNTHYVRVNFMSGITDVSTFAFHLTWDGSRTGFEPYESKTYPLPNVELRSAGSVYDELTPDGKLIRRVGVVDLGDLTWFKTSGGTNYERQEALFSSGGAGDAIVAVSVNDVAPMFISSKYTPNTASATYNHTEDKIMAISNSTRIYLYDSALIGKTPEEIKEAVKGVILYYALETPTEEQTSNTYQELTPIDDFGTQEFLYDEDVFPVPQGAKFFYPVDYKAFIDSVGGREDIGYDAGEIVSHTELQQALANFLSSISGYDATKSQTLKNNQGTFVWEDDEQ